MLKTLKTLVGGALLMLVTEELAKAEIHADDRASLKAAGRSDEDVERFRSDLQIAGASVFMRIWKKL